ncbi:caspase-3-like [Brachionichthys hirsutus]|uniref:caspase-3-like n=1 Tax=Brachionichthys hirsutus TaxID=412623 RepID=UPI003604576A
MGAKQVMRRNKVAIMNGLLDCDPIAFLEKCRDHGLVTSRGFCNLRRLCGGDARGAVIELMDCIMNEGDGACDAFLKLLPAEDFKDLHPHRCTDAPLEDGRRRKQVRRNPLEAVPCRSEPKDDVYRLSRRPIGLLLILNNENFLARPQRSGTERDVQRLAETYGGLGFRVLMCKDQTRDQMTRLLRRFASLADPSQLRELGVAEWSGTGFADLQGAPEHGDAFFCAVLSHGEQSGVYGVDGQLLSVNAMLGIFKATPQSPLVGKPKCFLIQACRGTPLQGGVPSGDLQTDGFEPLSVPLEADFLVAFATVEGYASVRHVREGSWFIQSLCKQLQEACLRGEDMLAALVHVNDEVSQKEVGLQPGRGKQMPEVRFTLRKRLVLAPATP